MKDGIEYNYIPAELLRGLWVKVWGKTVEIEFVKRDGSYRRILGVLRGHIGKWYLEEGTKIKQINNHKILSFKYKKSEDNEWEEWIDWDGWTQYKRKR